MAGGVYAAILAGGKGERFWPLSTERRPKQLLRLVGESTMLATAVQRLEGLMPADHVYVITSAALVEASRQAAPNVPAGHVIGEPVGRDTAAAVALATALVGARDPEGVFCVLTADHVIGDTEEFQRVLAACATVARQSDVLVTIGIQPTGPNIGFGYIEVAETIACVNGVAFRRGARFVEKPDLKTAEEYVRSSRYLWNGGMFVWSVAAIRRALRQHRPDLADLETRWTKAAADGTLDEALRADYPTLPRISIDYAVMEKAQNIVVASGAFGWDDVGTWTALENHWPKDAAGNVGRGQWETLDASRCIVVSEGRLTALLGVDDLIVVQAEGVTLICARNRAQDVKKLVQVLREKGRCDDVL